jgi:hypothetical protein
MKEPTWNVGPKMGGSGHTIEADETWIGGKAANRAYGPIPPKAAYSSHRDQPFRRIVITCTGDLDHAAHLDRGVPGGQTWAAFGRHR